MPNEVEESNRTICVDAFAEAFAEPPVLEQIGGQWYTRMDPECLVDIAKAAGVEVVPHNETCKDCTGVVIVDAHIQTKILEDGGIYAAKTVLGVILSQANLEGAKRITSKALLTFHPYKTTCAISIGIQVVNTAIPDA